MASQIRVFQAGDAEALSDICIRTGAAGEDARAVEEAPELLPAIFLDPYLAFAPQFAFVLEDALGPCGYTVGVADTGAFEAWQAEHWWPSLRAGCVDPGADPAAWGRSDWLRNWVHRPPQAPASLSRWPAHGHIDLLPRAQGKGVAAPLMLQLMQTLAQAGAGGIHLGVAAQNARALRFYGKLGFAPVPGLDNAEACFVARDLAAQPDVEIGD
ncbi:GNAT family N-acetyltransferase [Pseudoruegeria sp. SHC-113]|uniref:GNAT family N-acetyltransferase n=1 Tax=Pseudoruegeria sp. SHC-113 TaxID=2855439 RepID=UPI0021BB1221|nr:GNAT family N-acetyltransferase [Pseudoruegeria sp. SHC-113]MCT8161926.1 GNAT family N-acetyltransferase [Pseudoruegeria sp. SHC-113]